MDPQSGQDGKKWVLGLCIAVAIVLTPVSFIVGGWQASLVVYALEIALGAGVIWAIQR